MPYIDWMGKDDVINHHKNIEYKTIDCQDEIGEKNSDNMIIKGDNLLALKSLLPYYSNSIKMIYIDPPYNTGNTSWVYNDNMDSPLIKKWLDKTVNADDLSRSDKWLCMMYPRLKLLKELLKEDGVIFISIDDAEVVHLRMICDEIFGSENFLANFIWKKKSTSTNVEGVQVSSLFDSTICYAKNIKINSIKRRIIYKENRTYSKQDKDGSFRTAIIEKKNSGEYKRETMLFTILGQVPREGKRWQIGKKTARELELKNRFIIENGLVKHKIYNYEDKNTESAQPNILNNHGSTDSATKELNNIFNKDGIFSNPKPKELINHFIKISTSKNDIILDSFAGSGTTAQAVLEQNKEDGGNRKFILIETLDYAKTITVERVKRVIKGYEFKGKDKTTLYEKKLTTTQILKLETMEKISNEVNKLIELEKNNFHKIEKTFKDNIIKIIGIKDIKEFKDGLGGGFKYCELGDNFFDEYGDLNQNLTFEQIAKHLYFLEFKKPINKQNIETPFIGEFENRYIYFFKNRFLKKDMIKVLKDNQNYKEIIIYTEKTTISDDELKNHKIVIRYIPYSIKDN
jgi:adenine-specific DNA-methyltransferase